MVERIGLHGFLAPIEDVEIMTGRVDFHPGALSGPVGGTNQVGLATSVGYLSTVQDGECGNATSSDDETAAHGV